MSRNAVKLVESWDSYYDTGLLSPLASSDVAAVLCEGNKYTVLLQDGTEEIVDGDSCTCGHEREDEKTGMGTEARQGWQNRLAASCDHQKAALQAVDVGGGCSECGTLAIEKKDHTDKYENVLMQSFSCAGCGAERTEQ